MKALRYQIETSITGLNSYVNTASTAYTVYTSSSTLSSISANSIFSYINNAFFSNTLSNTATIKFFSIPKVVFKSYIKPTSVSISADGYLFNDYKIYNNVLDYKNYGYMYYNSNTALTAGMIFYDQGIIVLYSDSITINSETADFCNITGIENKYYLTVDLPVYKDNWYSSKTFGNSNTALTASKAFYNSIGLFDDEYNLIAGFSLSARETDITNNYYTLKIST